MTLDEVGSDPLVVGEHLGPGLTQEDRRGGVLDRDEEQPVRPDVTREQVGDIDRLRGSIGPKLEAKHSLVVDEDDLARFAELRLRLAVNGEVRQDAFASDMIHTPAPTLTELSGVQNWSPGDIVATGTPEDVAEHADSHTGRYLANALAADARGPR